MHDTENVASSLSFTSLLYLVYTFFCYRTGNKLGKIDLEILFWITARYLLYSHSLGVAERILTTTCKGTPNGWASLPLTGTIQMAKHPCPKRDSRPNRVEVRHANHHTTWAADYKCRNKFSKLKFTRKYISLFQAIKIWRVWFHRMKSYGIEQTVMGLLNDSNISNLLDVFRSLVSKYILFYM